MAAAVQVVGGVDPYADTIHVALVSVFSKVTGDALDKDRSSPRASLPRIQPA